jgi:hypothetical protein
VYFSYKIGLLRCFSMLPLYASLIRSEMRVVCRSRLRRLAMTHWTQSSGGQGDRIFFRHPEWSRLKGGVVEGPDLADAAAEQVPPLRFVPVGMTGGRSPNP